MYTWNLGCGVASRIAGFVFRQALGGEGCVAAVRAGLDRLHEPMAALFSAVVERILQLHEKQ